MSLDNKILEKVRDYAARSHGAQQRKYTPDPYIVHPVRVMEICSRYTKDTAVLAAALLHDVLEDTPVSKGEMYAFLCTIMEDPEAARTIGYVIELTDVYIKKDFPQWNRRQRKEKENIRMAAISSEAQTVKYADIIDNSLEIPVHDPGFARVFLYECRTLLKNMERGDASLRTKAFEMVEEGIRRV